MNPLSRSNDETMTIPPDLSDLVVKQVRGTTDVGVSAYADSPTASCPCCGTICQRIHSQYTLTLHDLLAGGRPIHLKVRVRRFFCEESTCRRKIFAERFPSLRLPRAKFTLRLQEVL
jgi:transposase